MDIPNDIIAHAEEVAREWGMEPGEHRMLTASIASALQSERERCARIAYAHISDPGLSDNPAYVRFNPADAMAKKIAAAIRTPDRDDGE